MQLCDNIDLGEIELLDLDKLKKYKCIYVIGHANPDADSIFSSFVLTKILKSKGINAKFCVLDKLYNYSYEDESIIKFYLNEKPILIDENKTKNLNFILVDHNDPEQSIKEGNVICAFDHHINSNKIKKCYSKEYTSTLLYIYDIFKDYYNFSEYEKKLIALTVICDSNYLLSSRFNLYSKKLYESLQIDIDISDLRKKFFKTTDFSKDIKNIFEDNYKVYNIDNKKINRVSIKAYKKDGIYLNNYKKYLSNLHGIWIIIWCEYDTNITYVLVKNDNSIKTIKYDYIITSTVLIIKDLFNNSVIK